MISLESGLPMYRWGYSLPSSTLPDAPRHGRCLSSRITTSSGIRPILSHSAMFGRTRGTYWSISRRRRAPAALSGSIRWLTILPPPVARLGLALLAVPFAQAEGACPGIAAGDYYDERLAAPQTRERSQKIDPRGQAVLGRRVCRFQGMARWHHPEFKADQTQGLKPLAWSHRPRFNNRIGCEQREADSAVILR